jgi:lipoprotein-anchoring transpeptidase ErfK/SrfK
MRSKFISIAAASALAVSMAAPAHAESFFEALANAFAGNGDSAAYSGRVLYPEDVPRSRVVPYNYQRRTVRIDTAEAPGTIIIDTRQHYLFLVLGDGRALRYGVGVGREGFGWKGTVRIGAKQEWPAWRPPKEMIAREAKRGHKLPTYMAGGKDNPLGARAMYLYGKGGDTGFRIHGTSEPWTIGLNVSSGCIRLVNEDVVDLYNRARIGAKVIVL